MLLQEEHQREMSSEVHMVPQSATLYNSSHHCQQESLGLMGKNPGYNNLSKATCYRSNLSGNNGYPHCPSSGNDSYSHNGNQSFKNTAARRQLFCDIANSQDIQSRSATNCMGIHPGTGCIKVKEWQHLLHKTKKEFLG